MRLRHEDTSFRPGTQVSTQRGQVHPPGTKERGEGNDHHTVKPLKLMNHLVQLFAPTEGVILDPFAGTGTLGLSAQLLGYEAILIENQNRDCNVTIQRLKEHRIDSIDRVV